MGRVQAANLLGVSHHAVWHHDQRGTCQQWSHDLPHTVNEAGGGLESHSVPILHSGNSLSISCERWEAVVLKGQRWVVPRV